MYAEAPDSDNTKIFETAEERAADTTDRENTIDQAENLGIVKHTSLCG